jgi:hypothetical protein
LNIEERIDRHEKAIDILKENPSVYSKAELLSLEILLDILRELVRQR